MAHAGPVRPKLVAELARRGDDAARKEVLATMIDEVGGGEDPEGPHWPNATFDTSFAPILSDLATAAATNSKALQFAVAALGQIVTADAAAFLDQLAKDRGGTWLIELAHTRVAAELAAMVVVGRLQNDALAAAQAFLDL